MTNQFNCLLFFLAEAIGIIQKPLSIVLSQLDEKQQKKEYYNISTLGNIEELGRIASDTASLLTLYYKEQIQSIDTLSLIEGSNIFNDKINWIKDVLINVRPEGKKEMPVVVVAEYITAWIMDTLKGGKKNLDPAEPLPQQLWFSVAQKDCADQGNMTALTDILGATAGRQKIPLKFPNNDGTEILVHAQLRHLIGCPSVVTKNGEIYQYNVSKLPTNELLADLNLYGYVYVTPFLTHNQSIKKIIEGRNLKEPHRDPNNNILTKLKEIEQYVETFQSQGDRTRKSAITQETARQVAQVLREEKSFVDPKDVKAILDKSREEMEIRINVLRDDIKEKANFYQTSIDATSEKLEKDVTEARQALKADNEKHYNDVLKKINEQLKQIEKNLENQLMERMNTIEKQLKTECNEMRKIVEAAKVDSNQALLQANEAVEASKQSAQHSKQAHEDAKKLVESTEQRRQEFQAVMDKCEANVKQTIAQQKEFCEQSITAVRTKIQQDFERTKQAAEQSSINAKESSQAAKETQKDTKRQLDLQKEETNKIISEVKEITKQNERSANEAKEASKQTKQGADASTTALKKIDEMQKKMENALERLEKLAKKLETK